MLAQVADFCPAKSQINPLLDEVSSGVLADFCSANNQIDPLILPQSVWKPANSNRPNKSKRQGKDRQV